MKRTFTTIYFLLIGLCSFAASAAPGDLDWTFSQDGKVVDTFFGLSNDQSYAAAVQADGKTVVAGTLNSSRELIGIIRYHCGIARYNTNGTLDTSFGVGGKLAVTFSSIFMCRALAIQADGKIIVAGNSNQGAGADFGLMRFNSDGTPDTSFDGDGRVTTNVTAYDTVTALVIQPDGKIIAAGVTNPNNNSNFAIVRYNPNGSLDTSFDGDGKVNTDFFSSLDYANGAALQADGKIVLAGYCNYGIEAFGLARYNADGSLDTSFDIDGKLLTNNADTGYSDRAQSVAIQADGKIVAAGYASMSSGASLTLTRYNPADGSLDVTFDGDGKVNTSVSPQSGGIANAVAIQPDGKIVAAGGSWSDYSLVRYNADGSLDNTFDGDGIVNTDFYNSSEIANGVAIAPDGRIVATGYFTLGGSDNDFSVARYNADGSLDTSFDGDGKTYTPMGFPVSSGASDVATQADGKIVVAGYVYNGSNDDFMVARYNTDGTPDPTFGSDGKVKTDVTAYNPFGERARAVAIQPDGKIIVAGHSNATANTPDFALVRYHPNGAPDFTFDGDGIVTTSFSSSEYINDIAVQPDGKIVAVGYIFLSTGGSDIAVARYNADGSPDTSFDGDGKLTTDFIGGGDNADSVAVQADGKIVVAGSAATGPGYDVALVRYNADGSLDTSFDGDGKLTTDFGSNSEGARAMTIQTDGKIVAAGSTGFSSSYDYVLARYNPDGSLDTSFDGDGKVITSVLAGSDNLVEIAIQTDGRIVAAGYSNAGGSNNDASLARYNSDGSLDNSFGTGGKRTFDINGASNDMINGMTLDPFGRIVVAGETAGNVTVARVLGDFAPRSAPFDFDGDGKSDISIFRPSNGAWWILKSSNGGNAAFAFGNSSDKLVPGDFTGDGKADIAIWRPASGEWFVLRSEDDSFYSFPFGTSGDVPVVGDFDADGKADSGVFRPSNSTWYINKSSGGTIIQQFGQAGDAPVVADYDGDGRSDIAIWRASAGQWWINRSTAGVIAYAFGNSADKPVQGDYSGDGKDDVAIYRPSTGEWFILRSENDSYYSFPFGTNGDLPAPGDYDGDGTFDAAVFRPSTSVWYVQRSTMGILTQGFGIAGDQPVPNTFVP